jgi:hypothetical protein
MKRICPAIFLALFLLSSCKRNHYCDCSTAFLEVYKEIKDTKKKAREQCAAFEKELQNNHPEMRCVLK